jgi:lysophospholipid acyltransferase (LPLAT)-like uncharacterized protein
MIRRLREILFVFAIEAVLRLSRSLWRVQVLNQPAEASGPHLYAHWHGDELLLVPVFAGRGYAVMASRSRDGEGMANLLRRLGYWVVRGSSSRGGAAGLKGLVDAVRHQGRSAAIAVDGPRGPVFQVKPGILFLAQSTGLPIIPAVGVASRAWKIPGAWNHGFYPKPLVSCVVLFGSPFFSCRPGVRERG